MKFSVKWIDVTKNLESGEQPVFFLERPLLHGNDRRGSLFGTAEVARKGEFWVPQNALLNAEDCEWSKTIAGQHVRVPIHAYRTVGRALPWLFAVAVELGMRAANSLRTKTRKRIDDVVLALGSECTDLAGENVDAFRCYVGIAVKVED